MSWLDDLNKDRLFTYKNPEDAEDIIYANSDALKDFSGDPEFSANPGTSIFVDGVTYEYAGMDPVQLGIMTKIPFEKNGRKAMRTKFGDGKQVMRSMAKENYMQGKGTESVLTKSCVEASEKVKDQIAHNRTTGMIRELKKQAHDMKEAKRK